MAPRKTAVLITGCSSGIGADAAARLVKCGFLTFATVRKESDIAALKQRCGNSNLLAPLLLDVTNADQIAAAVDAVRRRLQTDGRRLLGLVNNAGYADQCPIELASSQQLHEQYEANVFGTVAVTQSFLPLLRQYATAADASQSARLVLLSSVGGRFSAAGAGPYCSSKYAVEAIGDSLRMELKHWRIDVSLIEPGAIATEFFGTGDSRTAQRAEEARAAAASGALPAGAEVVERLLAADAMRVKETGGVPKESPACTSDAIEAALLDTQPLARYNAGWTSLGVHLLVHLPNEVVDFALGRHFR